ncbi:hypothetical protein G6L28_20725 [Agrobacterium larrymoorei]|uniref:phosphorylase family protein n=1 Tax=Agrobacterium larrymoorei TaxID=160699 RepID=UPI0015719204|nr:hypothetical protein [Agrobacterium larrymoorei]NTJ45014.1 hypothetical protein [Agrobacterium larrymoorei]
MKVLIVDDDTAKAAAISRVLIEAGVPSTDDIAHVTNAYDASAEMRRTQFDLLILDLMIPKARLAEPEIDGGQTLLRDIMARTTYLRPRYIVGLTSYDDARDQSEADFNNGLWSILKFDTKSADWIDQLTTKVRYIQSSAEAANLGQEYDYDVAFVCALAKPELEAVLALDCDWRELQRPTDPTRYWVGTFKVDGKTLRCVACHAAQMGMVATAAAVSKVSTAFRPRLVVMTGICAGREGDIQLGDVVVVNISWDYGSGKFHKKEGEAMRFAPDPVQIALDPMLRKHAEALKANEGKLDEIRRSYTKQKINSVLNVEIGAMASGAAVRADDGFFEELATAKRKVVAVEMEAYAVYATAEEMPAPRPLALVVKSVCDFANSEKNDTYQHYAAHTSAVCALEIVKSYFKDRIG